MHGEFERLTYSTIRIASDWTSSVGDFRFKILYDFSTGNIEAFTYSKVCFEKADDVEGRKFEICDKDITPVKEWFDSQYGKYLERIGKTD
ncbi:MAG: hypothetical protein VB112_02955 [Oscillospiraceae bacterium]|nr:hypothetical protein [Oscillospiraceae bacterium]